MYYYQRLRDLREDSDLKQQDIADMLEIGQVQYHRYESGKREMPFHMVIELAKFYKVSLDYIAGLTNDKKGLTRSELPPEETALIRRYRALSPQGRGRILERMDMLLERKNKAGS